MIIFGSKRHTRWQMKTSKDSHKVNGYQANCKFGVFTVLKQLLCCNDSVIKDSEILKARGMIIKSFLLLLIPGIY